jgi:hypothetical protein
MGRFSEYVASLEAERDRLREENAHLKKRLSQAGREAHIEIGPGSEPDERPGYPAVRGYHYFIEGGKSFCLTCAAYALGQARPVVVGVRGVFSCSICGRTF